MKAPATGANTLAIRMSGAIPGTSVIISGAVTLTGVDQTNPLDAFNTGSAAGVTITTNITTVADNAWVLDVTSRGVASGTDTAGGGQTNRWDVDGGANDPHAVGSTKGPVSPAGSTPMRHSWTTSAPVSHSVASFKPAAIPPPPPPPPPRGPGFGKSTRAASDVVAGLCELIGCECSDPVILSIEYPVGPVSPGFPIVIKGCGFGNNQDWNQFEVWLTLKDYNNVEVDVPLRTVQVRDDTAVAVVPGPLLPNVQGCNDPDNPTCFDPNVPENVNPDFPTRVRDQMGCLQVFRLITRITPSGPSGRWLSNPCFSIGFRAFRDVELLAGTDPMVQFLPNESPVDLEEDTYGISVCIMYGGGTSNATFSNSCHYAPCVFPPCHSASGTEAWQIGPLINDWVFTQFTLDRSANPGQLGVSDAYPVYPDGATTWNPHISWWLSSGNTMWYTGKLYITGPCGVPWRPGGPEVLGCFH